MMTEACFVMGRVYIHKVASIPAEPGNLSCSSLLASIKSSSLDSRERGVSMATQQPKSAGAVHAHINQFVEILNKKNVKDLATEFDGENALFIGAAGTTVGNKAIATRLSTEHHPIRGPQFGIGPAPLVDDNHPAAFGISVSPDAGGWVHASVVSINHDQTIGNS